VVVIKIYQYPPVKPEGGVQAALALKKEFVSGSKGINPPVKLDAFPNPGRIPIVQPPLDKVPHHVAHQGLRIGPGQKKMHQVVHLPILPQGEDGHNGKTFQLVHCRMLVW
jgi:hypothetical protein